MLYLIEIQSKYIDYHSLSKLRWGLWCCIQNEADIKANIVSFKPQELLKLAVF